MGMESLKDVLEKEKVTMVWEHERVDWRRLPRSVSKMNQMDCLSFSKWSENGALK